MSSIKPKKLALQLLVTSLVISAGLAILALVFGKFGDLQVRVIATSFTFSVGSVLALSCAAQIERRRFLYYSGFGVTLAVLAVVITIYTIWAVRSGGETIWKTVITSWLAAGATSHVCLLLMARVAKRFTWTLFVAAGSAYTLASMIAILMWSETRDTAFYRATAVVAVLLTLFTLIVPILHRESALDVDLIVKKKVPLTRSEKVFCPRCGYRENQFSTEVTCSRCNTVFVVKIVRIPETSA